MSKIRKNDQVEVIAGKDKGKKGKVLHVYPKLDRALVENINLMKKAQRKTQDNQKGGIVEMEALIALSNLMLVCKQCNKRVRTKIAILKDGTKNRECKQCGAAN
jgi:large subunit ribosomal protein L24